MKSHLPQAIGWFMAFFASVALVWKVEHREPTQAPAESVAQLNDVVGEVLTRPQQELLWTEVLHDQPVDQGTVVATGDSGGATLVMEDGTAIALSPKTQIRVSSGHEKGPEELIVTVLKGKVKVEQKPVKVANPSQVRAAPRVVKLEKVKPELKLPETIETVARELPVESLSAKAAPVDVEPSEIEPAEPIEQVDESADPPEPAPVLEPVKIAFKTPPPEPVLLATAAPVVEEEPVIEWTTPEPTPVAEVEQKLEPVVETKPEPVVEPVVEAAPEPVVEEESEEPKPIKLAAKTKEASPKPAIEKETFRPSNAPDQEILGETLEESPPPEVAVLRPDEGSNEQSLASKLIGTAEPLLTAERYIGVRYGISAVNGPLVEDTKFIGVVGRVWHLAFSYDTVPSTVAEIDGKTSRYQSRRLMAGWSFNLDLPFTSEELDVTPRIGIWTLDASLPSASGGENGEFIVENAPSVGLEVGWTFETRIANLRLWLAAELGRQAATAVLEETSIKGYRTGADLSVDTKRFGGPESLKLLGFYFYERVTVDRDSQTEGDFRHLAYGLAYAGIGAAYTMH